ncbi:MAG: helix-turn-helix transcriptional regulator [Clostridia bacterium]|nr:helix-turn-helix transcriptional regulator [Clostridia bacterium]
MFLNKKIKQARLEKKLTQKEFANLLTKNGYKTSHATVSNWELNISSPDVDTLQMICNILEKDGNYFFDFTNTTLNKQEIQNYYGSYSIELLENYSLLNDLGRLKAIENVKDLTKINEYTETKNKQQII